MSITTRSLSLAALGLAVIAGGGYIVTRRIAPASHRVAVADSIALADSALRMCRGLSGAQQMKCYEGFLVPLTASHGVRPAMGTLNVLGARHDRLRIDGHVYAHAIGIAAGRASGADVAGAFTSCTVIFQSGCYHGVIQAYFENVRAVDTATVNGLCSSHSTPSADQWLRFQCVHGMGHGLTMFYGHNLPRALEGCDLLRAAWDRESCYGGAFMENVVNATAPDHASHALRAHADARAHGGAAPFKALDATDLHYPCSIMAQRYLVACYKMQTSVMLHFTHGDIAAAARSCLHAPRPLRPVCYQGLGREISAYSRRVHAEAIRLCAFARAEYQRWCHVGVVKNFIDLTAKPGDGIAYCRSVTGSPNRLKCYEAVGEQIATLRNDMTQREAACAEVPEMYRAACRSGARLTSAPRVSCARDPRHRRVLAPPAPRSTRAPSRAAPRPACGWLRPANASPRDTPPSRAWPPRGSCRPSRRRGRVPRCRAPARRCRPRRPCARRETSRANTASSQAAPRYAIAGRSGPPRSSRVLAPASSLKHVGREMHRGAAHRPRVRPLYPGFRDQNTGRCEYGAEFLSRSQAAWPASP